MRFPISPAVRWVLANLFLHRGLSMNGGITQDIVYNRTRASLGLRGPMNVILKNLNANPTLVQDTDTLAAAELTPENIDFLLDRIFPLEKIPYQIAVLERLASDLMDAKRSLTIDCPAELPLVNTLQETWNVIETKDKEGDN